MLSFHVLACTPSTAQRERPAPSRVSAGTVLTGRGGVARSAVAVFVPRRRVYLETREMHEGALPGLNL